ncbi:MAG: hypothetical protein Fur0046_10820 [Cyanobacteria bacterium J069]|nr:MAG: adenylate/guanylate cyclase domain-containing protein [Cyanobacteria bacterium J069]
MSTDTEVELERLLQDRIQHPERAAEIDEQIRARFMETHAILVLDSSGFSRLSQEQGIIAALAEIERMRGIVSPIVEAHQGSPFKLEADNVYAVFPSVERAIAASREMMRQLATIDKHVSIGIGYGDLIMISDSACYHDVYGEEMNLASKLGEDLAAHDEVLLTEAAFQQLRAEHPAAPLPVSSPAAMTISNLTIQVYRLTPNP